MDGEHICSRLTHTVTCQCLALGYLLHEESFPLLNVGGKAFLDSFLHGNLDFFPLLFSLDLGFFPCNSGLSFGLSLQGFPEIDIVSPLVIEIGRVCCWCVRLDHNDDTLVDAYRQDQRASKGRHIPTTPVKIVPTDIVTTVDVCTMMVEGCQS